LKLLKATELFDVI